MRTLLLTLVFLLFTPLITQAAELEFNKLIEQGDETQRDIASDLQKKSGIKNQQKTPASTPTEGKNKGLEIKLKPITKNQTTTINPKKKKKKRSTASTAK